MIDPDNIVHVYPVNDAGDHDTTCEFPLFGIPICNCKCKPRHKVEQCGTGMIIVHNSFDGREWIERAYDIINDAR